MASERHTPPPGRGFKPFEEPWDENATVVHRDTEPAPVEPPRDPASMTPEERAIETLMFLRSHHEQHERDTKERKAIHRLVRSLDAELEMIATSVSTILRKVVTDEAADELAEYYRTKRRDRDAAADAANGGGNGHS